MNRIGAQFAVAFAAFFTLSTGAAAQGVEETPPLFEQAPVDAGSLQGSQAVAYAAVSDDPSVESVTLVYLREDLEQQKGLALKYDPNQGLVAGEGTSESVDLYAVMEEVNVLDDEAYAWVGQVRAGSPEGEELGPVTLIYQKGDEVTGTLSVDGETFEVHPLGAGLHALVNVDDEVFETPPDAPSDVIVEGEYPPAPPPSGPLPTDALAVNVVRVLVLYTPAAQRVVSNVTGKAHQAIQEMNTALRKSDVVTVRIELAAVRPISFNETGNIWGDQASISNNTTAQSLRAQFAADVVVLFTGTSYSGAYGATKLGPNNNPYNIVEIRHSTAGDYTFAHEVGHFFGGQHHPEDEGVEVEPSWARGHRFRSRSCFLFIFCGWKYHATLMAQVEDGYRRIPYYSNPYVSYRGVPTGRNDRYNAFRLQQTAPILAGYTNLAGDPPVGIEAMGNEDTGQYTVSAAGAGASGATYEWRFTRRPGRGHPSWGHVVGTGPSLDVNVPPGFGYVRLVVRTAGGGEVVRYAQLRRRRPCHAGGCLGGGAQSLAASGPALRVSTNPIRGAAELVFELPSPDNVTLSVFDALGREVALLATGAHAPGEHRATLDAAALPSGTYVVRLLVGTTALTERVTVLGSP